MLLDVVCCSLLFLCYFIALCLSFTVVDLHLLFIAVTVFMILFIACKLSTLFPWNQFPKAECILYAKSIAMSIPVGEG